MVEKYSYNFLQNNGFTFALERIPQTLFRVVACDVPSLTVPPAEAGYPGSSQYFPGTFNEFEELTMEFLVDEDLKNYEEIYHWITQQRFAIGKDFVAKNDSERFLVSDGMLVTLDNSSNPNRVFHFKSMFPISLGNLHFDTSITQPEPITCQVTFRYSTFVLKPKAPM